jgi:hypothetical protein
MVLGDRGSQMGFATEIAPKYTGVPGHESDPDPDEQGPAPLFEGRSRTALVRAFPWDKLQVLAVQPGHSPCQS